MKNTLLSSAFFLLLCDFSFATSATWDVDPTNGDWNTAVNWTPDTVPNGLSQTATFAVSNITDVSISAFTTVGGIIFDAGASAFTISTSLQTLQFERTGVVNNSGITQQFLIPVGPTGGYGLLEFFNTATAGSDIGYIIEGSETAFDGGRINFWDNSTAGSGSFVLQGGGSNARTTGGRIFFMETSTAGNGTFDCQSGGSGNFGGTFAAVNFQDSASAGDATLIAEPAADTNSFYGTVIFNGESTAANATLIANDGGRGEGGVIFFNESATGDRAAVKVYGNGNMQMHVITGTSLTIGSLEGDGILFMESKNLTVGSNKRNTIFRGAIEGSGSLTKIGAGVFVLAENGERLHTGPVIVERGALFAGNSRVSATGSGPVQVNHGTFGGSGKVAGAVTIGNGIESGAVLSPGINGVGVLTLQSTLGLKFGSQYNWDVEADAGKADETIASGITFGASVTFAVNGRGNIPLAIGTVFTVISNTAGTPISGTFANLPDGGTIISGSNTFQANYEGGDGNDLTLTVVTL